jgi:hypothetical protein
MENQGLNPAVDPSHRAPARTAEQRIAEIYATQRRKLTRQHEAAMKREQVLKAAHQKAYNAAAKAKGRLTVAEVETARLASQLAALDKGQADD